MKLSALARAIGAELLGDDRDVFAVAPLSDAGTLHLAGLFEARWRTAARSTQAGAVLLSKPFLNEPPASASRLVCEDPRQAWGDALRLLHPSAITVRQPIAVHPSSVVHPDAQVDWSVRIGPLAIIQQGAVVGPNTTIHGGAYVGAGAQIGADCVLHPRATVLDGCVLGDRVQLGAGAVIGDTGFGIDAAGRVPHIGTVIIGDDVSIGANSCVDRATLGATRIGQGAHLDNLVQVGHNAQIGPRAILCGQVGVAGGAIIEADAVLGGQVGVAGNATVGAGARIAAQSGVTKSLAPGGTYSGHPAEDNQRRLRRLASERARRRGSND